MLVHGYILRLHSGGSAQVFGFCCGAGLGNSLDGQLGSTRGNGDKDVSGAACEDAEANCDFIMKVEVSWYLFLKFKVNMLFLKFLERVVVPICRRTENIHETCR